MNISQRLFEYMKRNNISQVQLTKGTGISATTISDWKTKGTNPSADKIACICDFLGVSTDWLLTGEEREERETRKIAPAAAVTSESTDKIIMEIEGRKYTLPATPETYEFIRGLHEPAKQPEKVDLSAFLSLDRAAVLKLMEGMSPEEIGAMLDFLSRKASEKGA